MRPFVKNKPVIRIFIYEVSGIQKRKAALNIGLILFTFLLSSCSTVALKTFASIFGQQLISVAAHNYSPDYGNQVEELLLAFASETKKARSNEQSGQVSYSQQGFNNQDYQDNVQQGDNSQDYSQPYSSQDYNNQDYSQQANDNQQNYPQQPLSLDIAVLAQRSAADANTPPIPINDGDTLYSIPGDPLAGDKIKISFKANADCYVYVVGIDATGYVASIFPDASSNLINPVSPDRNYLVPGEAEWYGLDDYKGIEEIYFIASYNRRLDLERIIKMLSEQERTVPTNYQNVQVAAVIPQTRGLVKVKTGSPAKVKSSFGSEHSYKPTTFIANSQNADLTITRWFNHD